ncbi:MAG TPA: hypothetical protein DGO89_09425 [Microcoleaceae bacterium UBA9251]|nr:hypothetical protein [Microcoleaceae cyanobacterium UBA9251]
MFGNGFCNGFNGCYGIRGGWLEAGFLRKYWLIALNIGENPVSWAESINQKPGFFQHTGL